MLPTVEADDRLHPVVRYSRSGAAAESPKHSSADGGVGDESDRLGRSIGPVGEPTAGKGSVIRVDRD
jgi:hypothetical protein